MRSHPYLDDYVRGVSDAIDRRRWDEAKEGVRIFFDLVTALIDHVDQLAHVAREVGDGTVDAALGFRGDLEALYSAYTRIFEATMHPGVDRSVLGAVLYVPWGVAQRAIRGNLPSLANRFMSGGREGMTDLVRRLDSEGQEFARDRLTRFPSELFTFLLPHILDSGKERDLETAVRVARDTLGYLGQLAKKSIDRGDFDDFVGVAKALDSIPELDPYVRQAPPPASEEAGRWHARERLHVSKNAVVLGVAGWIMRCRREDPSLDVDRWLNPLASCISCRHLVLGFEDAQDFETQDSMGWDWWLLEGRDGEVVRIDFGGLVDLAFLEFVSRCGEEELLHPDEPATVRQLQYHFEDARLGKVLRDGLEGGLFSERLVQAKEAVGATIQRVHAALSERWSNIVVKSPASSARLQRFRDHLVIGWESGGALRNVFAHFDHLVEEQEDAQLYRQGQWRGVNVLLDKEYFVDGSNVATDYLAEQYGRSIAQGQDNSVWNSLVTGAVPTKVEADLLLSTVRDHLGESAESFLLVGNWPEGVASIRGSSDFQYAMDAPWEGELGGHKVFHRWSGRSGVPGAIICTPESLPTWVQWHPWLVGEMQALHATLKGRLREIDDEVAAELRFSGERPSRDELARKVQLEAYARASLRVLESSWVLLQPDGRTPEV